MKESKFAKSPCPDRAILEALYNSGKTQKEIGKMYDVGYQTVIRWMQNLGINSRGILHIVKRGVENPQWKGNKASYTAMHKRVESIYGRPKKCTHCGTSNVKKTYDWACIGDYKNVSDYVRLCRSCHFKMDKIHISTTNKRKDFDSLRQNERSLTNLGKAA